jgi:hypothetical protein
MKRLSFIKTLALSVIVAFLAWGHTTVAQAGSVAHEPELSLARNIESVEIGDFSPAIDGGKSIPEKMFNLLGLGMNLDGQFRRNSGRQRVAANSDRGVWSGEFSLNRLLKKSLAIGIAL